MHIPVDESPSNARNRNARACIIIGVRKPSAAGWLNLRKKDEMGCGGGFHLPFRCVWEGKNNKPFNLKRKKQTRRNYLLGCDRVEEVNRTDMGRSSSSFCFDRKFFVRSNDTVISSLGRK